MATHEEIFHGQINIDVVDAPKLIKSLEKLRSTALSVFKDIEAAAKNIKIDFGGGLDPAAQFGTVLGSLKNIGARAGVSELSGIELDMLAQAVQKLSQQTGQTLPEIVANFDKLKDTISETSGISVEAIEQRIGGGLAQVVATMEGTSTEVEQTWAGLAQRLVGGSIIPEMVESIQRYFRALNTDIQMSSNEIRDILGGAFKAAASSAQPDINALTTSWNAALVKMAGSGNLTVDQLHQLTNAMVQVGGQMDITAKQIRAAAESFDRQQQAGANFERIMGQALQQTTGFREGLSLAAGGEGLLGLRTAFMGTGDATGTFGKLLDGTRSALARLSDETTKEEKALRKSLDAYLERNVAMRNAVDQLKVYGKESGVAKEEVGQLTESIRRSMNASFRQADAARANGELTKAGAAEMRGAINVMKQQLALFREQTKGIQGADEAYGAYLDSIEQFIRQQEREVDISEARNKAAKKSKESREEENKSMEEQGGILKRLLSSLGLFNRGQKDTVDTGNRLVQTFGGMQRSLLSLVGAFTAGQLAADAIRGAFRKVSDVVGQVKREFLGFGVIEGFLQDLFTGTVEFAAKLEQLQKTMQVVGQQGGYSLDFVNKKFYELRDANIAAEASSNLMIKSFALGTTELTDFTGVLEGTTQGVELLMAALGDKETGMPGVLAALNDQFNDLITGLNAGDISMSQMTIELFKMAGTIQDPVEQMRFMKIAMDEGVLGMSAMANAAKNAGASLGKDTADSLEAFINAVQRGTTETAEQYGVVSNASQFFDRYGEVIDGSADSLSTAQKQQATFLGVLQDTLPFMEVYNEVSEMSGKKITSMNRVIEDTKQVMGDLFLPVLGDLLGRFEEFLKALQEIASSQLAQDIADQIRALVTHLSPVGGILETVIGGFQYFGRVLFDVIHAVEQFMSGDFAEGFGSLKDAAVDAITVIALTIGDKIQAAITWGYNLVANLANGIIEAAQTVLVQAANFIGDILSLFFAPGSPPKEGKLKKIESWGSSLIMTMGEGMVKGAGSAATSASDALSGALSDTFRNLELPSFGIVKDAVGQIRGIFQAMVGRGRMDETQLVPGILEARELMAQLADEFEETGEVSEEILSKIGDRLGEAGKDVKDYIRLQFELQSAKKDLEKIDEEIAAAEAAGFVPAAMRRRKEEAEQRIDTLSEQMQLQKELLDWQQESNSLVKQQVDLLKRIADQNERAARSDMENKKDAWQQFLETYDAEMAALETKKALGIITEEEYLRARLGLEQRYIDTAIRMNKPLDQARIDAFKELQKRVESMRGGGKGSVEALAGDVFGLNTELIDMGNAAAEGFEEVKKQMGGSTEEFDRMRERITGFFDQIGGLLSTPIDVHLRAITDWLRNMLPSDLGRAAEKIKEILGGAFEFVSKNAALLLGGAVAAAFAMPMLRGGGLGGGMGGITGLFGTLLGPLKAIGAAIIGITGPIGAVVLAIGALAVAFILFRDEIGGVTDAIKGKLQPVFDIVEEVIRRVYGLIKTVVVNLVQAFGNFLDRLLEMESLRRAFSRLFEIIKAVGIVIGVALAAALVVLSGIIEAVTATMDPLLNILADIIDVIASLAVVAYDMLITPFKLVFALFNEGPKGAWKVLKGFFGDIREVIKSLGRFLLDLGIGMWETVFNGIVGFLDGIVGAVTGKFGLVSDFFDEFGEKVLNTLENILDSLGFLGDGIRGVADVGGKALRGLGRMFGLVKDDAKKAALEIENTVTVSLSDLFADTIVGATDMAVQVGQGMQQVAREIQEADLGRALGDLIQQGAQEVGSKLTQLFGEQNQAASEYSTERKNIFSARNAEILALEQKTNDEIVADLGITKDEAILQVQEQYAGQIAELDKHYREEAEMRRQAIAQSLLDLNNQIMQEKLMRAELTGAEAAAIVQQHQDQAQQIAEHYGLPEEAARQMSEQAVSSLRAAALANEDFLANTSLNLGQALTLFDQLETEGYDALSTKSKERISELIVDLALFQQANGATFGDIQQTLSALPTQYQEAVLTMMGQNANIETILGALGQLDRTYKPTVEVDVKMGKDAREPMRLQSPKTQFQTALESLVEYTTENPINVQILLPEDLIAIFEAFVEAMMQSMATAEEADRMISAEFDKLERAVSGPTGSMTRMFRDIREGFRSLPNYIMPTLNKLMNTIVGKFAEIGFASVTAFVDQLKNLAWMIGGKEVTGSFINIFWQIGDFAMEALRSGLEGAWRRHLKPLINEMIAELNRIIDMGSEAGQVYRDLGGGTGGAAGLVGMDIMPVAVMNFDYLGNVIYDAAGAIVGALSGITVEGGGGDTNLYISELSFPGVANAGEAEAIWSDFMARGVRIAVAQGQAGGI